MKATKAIAILSIPFAAVCLASLSAMCLTSYWDCSQVDLSLDLWKPAAFLLVVFSAVAALVLHLDLLLIRHLAVGKGRLGLFMVAGGGALLAVLPRILLAVSSGLGVDAFSPRWEHLPLAISGAIFALLLHNLVGEESRC